MIGLFGSHVDAAEASFLPCPKTAFTKKGKKNHFDSRFSVFPVEYQNLDIPFIPVCLIPPNHH